MGGWILHLTVVALALGGPTPLPLAAQNDVAPSFQGKTSEGAPFDLAKLGGEVVLLDFWATWCEPCRLSLPRYAAMQRKLGAQGLHIVGVSVDEEAENLKRFLASHAIGFAVVHDADARIVEKYQPPKMPTAYLIGRDGRIRLLHAGFVAGDEVVIEAAVLAALAQKTP